MDRTTRHTTLLHPPPMAGHREGKRIHNGPAPAVRDATAASAADRRRRSLQVPDSQTARRPYPSCTSPPRETRPNQPPTSHLTRAFAPSAHYTKSRRRQPQPTPPKRSPTVPRPPDTPAPGGKHPKGLEADLGAGKPHPRPEHPTDAGSRKNQTGVQQEPQPECNTDNKPPSAVPGRTQPHRRRSPKTPRKAGISPHQSGPP